MTSPSTAIVDTSALRVPPGPVDLRDFDPHGTPGCVEDKAAGKAALQAMGEELADLQERLWANRDTGTSTRILLVMQGMDTSGKGGVIRKTLGLVDPQGLQIKAFKAPTEEEKQHDFLWRIRKEVPTPGHIGVFDRSHYEDVLVVKVREWASPEEIERRYDAINQFEQELVEDGVVVLKCMLHLSAREQKERLLARLDNPEKHWKYNPGDVDDRALWPDFQAAYATSLERTNTDVAPWHIVPADRKWYRNLAMGQLLLETLRGLDLSWPGADFDVEEQRRRIEELEIG